MYKRQILGGSDLDQSGKFLAKLMTKLMMPVFYPFIANGEMKIPFMKKKMDKMLAEDNGYIRAFMDMIKTPDVDMSHITKRSVENQFYSDLITPLPDQIDPSGTQIHILYALNTVSYTHLDVYKRQILGWTEPFSIVQILWINLIMDTLAAMAFGGEPILDRYMNEKPALRKDNILTTYIKSAI